MRCMKTANHAVVVAKQLLHLNVFATHFACEAERVLAHLRQLSANEECANVY